ncbi:MAG TPA: heme o synthase [Candidatus Binatia bacterium]|nr:heme o synthase [Candidatus Binatia bacterium]
MSLKDYYKIAKPGMVYGNLIPLVGGFALGSGGDVHGGLFAATIVGSALGMASGCVFNNWVDHDIDAKMSRTKHRALAAGRLSRRTAFIYGAVLGLLGCVVFALRVNLTALIAGEIGFFFYVVMYSMWWKRTSPWGTAVGSVAGAMPPVVGYLAATGKFDLVAAILFVTMVAWQMPHFFAIAIRHRDDYAAAGIPVLPVVRGTRATKAQMFVYLAVFAFSAPLLAVIGNAGRIYFYVALAAGLAWLALGATGFRLDEKQADLAWARNMFVASLFVIVSLFAAMTISAIV